MVICVVQVLQDALVSSSWSVEAAMALLCEGDSVGDKKRPVDARSHRKGNTDHSTNVSLLWNLFLMSCRALFTDTLVKDYQHQR
jgi:hypothetical protein